MVPDDTIQLVLRAFLAFGFQVDAHLQQFFEPGSAISNVSDEFIIGGPLNSELSSFQLPFDS